MTKNIININLSNEVAEYSVVLNNKHEFTFRNTDDNYNKVYVFANNMQDWVQGNRFEDGQDFTDTVNWFADEVDKLCNDVFQVDDGYDILHELTGTTRGVANALYKILENITERINSEKSSPSVVQPSRVERRRRSK